ncbi:hypothetical protein C8J56DRAFT_900537 [Mycena floridula]|nr:hypothetical protein C8J56DRAFT_900537 [Mycena floridula]
MYVTQSNVIEVPFESALKLESVTRSLEREKLRMRSERLTIAFKEHVQATNLAQNREQQERNEIIPAILLEQDIPRNPEWVSRVTLQCTQFNHLREFGESNIADQGIGFDGDSNPHERERDAAYERDAAAAYFLQNNLDPGQAFVQNTAGINANAGRVPLQDRGHRDRPPHMQENADLIQSDQHDHNSSMNDPSGPEDSDSGSDSSDVPPLTEPWVKTHPCQFVTLKRLGTIGIIDVDAEMPLMEMVVVAPMDNLVKPAHQPSLVKTYLQEDS